MSNQKWAKKGNLSVNNGSFPQLKTTKAISAGYSFEPKGLSIAPKTLANFLECITQLYDQGVDVRRIGKYFRNWWRWVRAGVEILLTHHMQLFEMIWIHNLTSKPCRRAT
jgi:hypothetical protein